MLTRSEVVVSGRLYPGRFEVLGAIQLVLCTLHLWKKQRGCNLVAMEDIAEQHIFFVDDEPTVRDVVRDTLEEPGIRVSCFAHPAECLEQLHCQRCDLLITDLKMPEMDGVELLRDARGLTPWLPVLVITGYGDIRTAVKAMKAGAVDFIEKPLVKDDFVQKVKSILQKSASADTYLGKPLTRTEKRVLELVVDGKSNKEIANLLHRSKRTIEVHRAHLMEKLGVDNLVDLVKRVAAMRLIDLQTGRERGEATRNSNKGP